MNAQQQAVLDRFTAGAAQLNVELAQLSEMDLDWTEGPGGWSIRQIVLHLADGGVIFSQAIMRALAVPGSRFFFNDFPGNEAWSDGLRCGSRPVEPALNLIMADWRYLAELVECFSDAWERQIVYVNGDGAEQSRATVQGILEMLAEHMEEHLASIRRIKAAHGAG